MTMRRTAISLFVAATCVTGVAIAGLSTFFAFLKFESANRFDRASSDYQYVTSLVQPGGDAGWQEASVDLGQINSGDWQFICVVGAYNDPADVLRDEAARRGVALLEIQRVRTRAFGLSPVEESEGAISFVDRAGRGRSILIDGFERLELQHGKRCFAKENAVVILPIRGPY